MLVNSQLVSLEASSTRGALLLTGPPYLREPSQATNW